MYVDNVKDMICHISDNLRLVMEIINKGNKIVFVIDSEEKLCGVVTDGDIRRFLLEGGKLTDEISNCMKKNYKYINVNDSNATTFDLKNGISIVPVVDEMMHLRGYNKADIMCVPVSSPQLCGNEYKYMIDAFLSTWISSSGEYIGKFEENFSKYCGMKYGVTSSNGTTALHLALLALGIGEGDEVIVPELTFAATINAVLYVGATPVVVDVEEESWCIDPKCIRSAISKRTKAIIPVHVYGQVCDMNEIMSIAKEYNLLIVEDCAEAHGAEYLGKKVGSFGDISCFSFYANKVITTGEGGMCLTNSLDYAERMRILKAHGMSKERRYFHEMIGYNYRMTNLQAAIGTAQLERIDDIIDWRKKLEKEYFSYLHKNNRIVLQNGNLPNRKKVVWLVSILIPKEKRDQVRNELGKIGVDLRFFFSPLTEMPIYSKYRAGKNEISRRLSLQGINLPTVYDISHNTVRKICEIINTIVCEENL